MMAATTGSMGVMFSMLSALLDYLDPSMQHALSKTRTLLNAAHALPLGVRVGPDRFINEYVQHDLVTLQEYCVALFDRNHATSLYLFERMHGESRDRGQAMVDLLNTYEKQDLHLRPGELPDYLPVFFGYLSCSSEKEARSPLTKTGKILQTIITRLTKRAGQHRFVVGTLLLLADVRHSVSSGGGSVDDGADMPPNATDYWALSAAYTDKPMRFAGAETPVTEPLHFYDKRPGHPYDPRGPR